MPSHPVRIFDRAKAILTPSLPDLFLAVVLLAVWGRAEAGQRLLADGDTGWHIRTGELILASGSVPAHDPFSFSRPGEPWFAWEWLADVALALAYRWQELAGVAGLAILMIGLSAMLLFAWLLRRGAGFWIAAVTGLAVCSASSAHFLARPHLFSLLCWVTALWILDEDRRHPSRRIWLLVPCAAVWANLHGGFIAWLGTLALLVLVSVVGRNRPEASRYGLLLVLSAAATLVNPYGWRLHQHVLAYLSSPWIQNSVQEYQSPSFRSESMLVFAILLLAGVAAASRALARREWFEGALVFGWALAALWSTRHIPIYAMAAAPVIAAEWGRWWRERAARSAPRSRIRILWEIGQLFGRRWRPSLWASVLGALVFWALLPARVSFAESRFPVAAVSATAGLLAPGSAAPRILTSDQWGDYLIFRLYPRQRVFYDGRSDFYGSELGREYQQLQAAGPRWPEILARYDFEILLLPIEWPLVRVLERDPGWHLVYRDAVAQLMTRRPSLKNPRGAPMGRE